MFENITYLKEEINNPYWANRGKKQRRQSNFNDECCNC